MKVIFLDCDGVLNYTKYYVTDIDSDNYNEDYADIDPKCVKRVLNICKETGAKIVISSDWRISWPGAKSRLERAGFSEGLIIDKTPEFMWRRFNGHSSNLDNSRGAEIEEWLNQHPECTNYVILDDREDFNEDELPHFVKVDPMYGLTDDHVKIAINILKHH